MYLSLSRKPEGEAWLPDCCRELPVAMNPAVDLPFYPLRFSPRGSSPWAGNFGEWLRLF
jgi:hypothetical protein